MNLIPQMKGLLNRYTICSFHSFSVIPNLYLRLSEQNIATILTSIEELYRSQRRNGLWVQHIKYSCTEDAVDVTTTLTRLIIDGISSHSTLLDAFVVVHATLVASLHKIVGVDFGTDNGKLSG